MTGKIFVIENSNLESTAVSIDDVKAKLKDVTFDYVSILSSTSVYNVRRNYLDRATSEFRFMYTLKSWWTTTLS